MQSKEENFQGCNSRDSALYIARNLRKVNALSALLSNPCVTLKLTFWKSSLITFMIKISNYLRRDLL